MKKQLNLLQSHVEGEAKRAQEDEALRELQGLKEEEQDELQTEVTTKEDSDAFVSPVPQENPRKDQVNFKNVEDVYDSTNWD